MPWKIEFSVAADRELVKLDAQHARRHLKFLHARVTKLDDPRSIGQPLQGSRLGEFWKYRVGVYRQICKIEEDRLIVLVLRAGRRKEIYRCARAIVSQRASTPNIHPSKNFRSRRTAS
jgi:mRNA interferase RelE/StbE